MHRLVLLTAWMVAGSLHGLSTSSVCAQGHSVPTGGNPVSPMGRFHPYRNPTTQPTIPAGVRQVNAQFYSDAVPPQGNLAPQPWNSPHSAPYQQPQQSWTVPPQYGDSSDYTTPPQSPETSPYFGPPSTQGHFNPSSQYLIPFSPGHTGPIDGERGEDDLVTLVSRDESLAVVLSMIAEQHGLNVVSGDEVNGRITVTLKGVPLGDALDSILTVNGYTWSRQKNILLISRLGTDTQMTAAAQGRILRVFSLNYVSALDIDKVVQGLLSPVGQSVITQTDPIDKRRTREEIVIEDLPDYVARIASYIMQVDRPPLQVSIEAHVLQVDLKDDTKHGVNFQELLDISNTRITLETTGFADSDSSPAFFLGVDSTDLNGLIEALKTTTDAKTLASPKVLVLNGQEARIQVGESLGYLVTTTTQTSTLQNVDFLDVGVVLNVTPIISQDGRILMQVKPEVSGGRINPDTGLPDRDTTEVQTTVMLQDGQGMIIGGLIKEEETEIQNKLPIAGDLWLVGRAFQRRSHVRNRSEIIIALVPRILSCGPTPTEREMAELERATTPLLEGPLRRVDRRSWEPELPDAMRDPRRVSRKLIPNSLRNLHEPYPNPKEYYFPSISEEASGLYGPYGFHVPQQPTR
ncbi:MAG: hypothetical protein R3C02_15090 [Planctomycetaceae bacterium]